MKIYCGKVHATIYLWKFYVSIGWFPGEAFKLFSLTLMLYNPDVELLAFFDFQIAKLCLDIGIA